MLAWRRWIRRSRPAGMILGLLASTAIGADEIPSPVFPRLPRVSPVSVPAPPGSQEAEVPDGPSVPATVPLPIPGVGGPDTLGFGLPDAIDPEDGPPPVEINPLIGPVPPGIEPAPPAPRPIYPIDLVGALRLAGARDLEIAMARQRIAGAIAALQLARVQWLPSVFYGPNWTWHDGAIQDNEGNVFNANRSSAFIGGTGTLGQGVAAPPPGGGPAQVSSLTSILRFSDIIFEPLAARQVAEAQQANLAATTNDTLLGLAEAYFDLQRAAGRVSIAREAIANAEDLVALTRTYARTGAGLEADYRRSLTELEIQRQNLEEAAGQLRAASAEVVRRTRLDPRILVAPVEPPETVIRMVDRGAPLDDLIVTGLTNRPELAEAQALVQATLYRLKQARVRPFVPSLVTRFSAGGFGGGAGDFWGNFDGRTDADVNLFWGLTNFGLGDRAIIRGRAAQQREAVLDKMRTQDLVASEVSAAYELGAAAERRLYEAAQALPEAIRSLDLNLTNIRQGAALPGATRPIEVLQPIQALAQARLNYLDSALAFNRAQFRLYHALGRPPMLPDAPSVPPPPGPTPLLAPNPASHGHPKLHTHLGDRHGEK